jgi:hypothetical protein
MENFTHSCISDKCLWKDQILHYDILFNRREVIQNFRVCVSSHFVTFGKTGFEVQF